MATRRDPRPPASMPAPPPRAPDAMLDAALLLLFATIASAQVAFGGGHAGLAQVARALFLASLLAFVGALVARRRGGP